MSYQQKYIKYKNKYMYLKKIQKGGLDCNNEIAFKNILGTCWMITIQMIFSFGDVTSKSIECIMKSIQINDKIKYINAQIQKVKNDNNLKKVLPNNIFNIDKIDYLKNILDKFIDRYTSKVLNINSEKLVINPKKNTKRCELLLQNNFKNLFNEYNENTVGGNIIEEYLFANILSIFFLGYKINFISYYQNNFNKIEYNDKEDIGIIVEIYKHVCCFFICNNTQKYYNDNDNKIIDCNWKELLQQTNDTNNLYIKNKECLIILNKEQYKYYKNKFELSKVLCLTLVTKNLKNNKLINQINNIINKKNLDNIYDKSLLTILGNYYEKGVLVDQNYKNTLKYYKLAADQGDDYAQYYLGMIYQNGEIVEQNYQKALDYYSQSACRGNALAQYNLGWMYYNAKGTEQNFQEAIKYFKSSAEQGYDKALHNLAGMYYDGEGVTQDYKEAAKYYTFAADQGYVNSQYILAEMYYFGEDIPQDYKEAAKYFSIAADQGFDKAQYNLAVMYYSGEGIEQDFQQAKKYYDLASKQGFTKAYNNLGIMYYKGEGVKQNYKQALKYFKIAADLGDSSAQNNLAEMYKKGEGV
jgi:TPR repeat protein